MSKTNYSNYSKHKNLDVVDIVETADGIKTYDVSERARAVETPKAIRKPIKGIVSDCVKLNIRHAPNPMATIACVIPVDTEVEIDIKRSTDEWYSVVTATGVEGYCMKKFISKF